MNILFVCTDNVGRSLVAELLLKKHLAKNNIDNIEVFSAGTNANSDTTGFDMRHLDQLQQKGVDATKHQRTQLSIDLVKNTDLIIAMDMSHQKWIKDKYGIDVPLFNEIYKNEKTSVIFLEIGALNIVNYINDAIPKITEYLQAINK